MAGADKKEQDFLLAAKLLPKLTLRHWRHSWGVYLLLLAIVAIGVGSFNGIRQASRAASANFGLFNEAVSGRSDFLIEAKLGGLREDDLFSLGLLSTQPDWHLLPVIEGSVAQLSESDEAIRQLRLIGLDLISVANLPRFRMQGLQIGGDDAEWYDYVGKEDLVWITYDLAEQANLKTGDAIRFSSGGRVRICRIGGVLGDAATDLPDDLIIADIPAAQSILSRENELDRVEVLLADPSRRTDTDYLEVIEGRLLAVMPENLELLAAEERAADRASMTQAFRLNLMILSLIAILVGAYLILQALDGAVVRRRNEMATLRSLGISARTLFFLCLFEAFIIGLFGSFAGIGVGYLLALGAVHLLTDTVNALYFATSAEVIRLNSTDWWIGMILGSVFSVLAGWLPARDAMETPPAQVLSRGDWSPGFAWLRRPIAGICFLAVGACALFIPPPVMESGSKMAIGGFLAAGCWIFGAALLSGQVLVWLATRLKPLGKNAVWRIAITRLADGSSRHRLAVAGLVVAVGMVTGMFQMVGSFRSTIVEWFDVRFQAELYISERGVGGAGTLNGIAPEIIETLSETPEVDFLDTLYVERVEAPRGITMLAGVDFGVWEEESIQQIWLKPPGVLIADPGAEPAYISETFARRFDLLNGGTVELETAIGSRAVTPIGIYSDYGNEFGAAVIDLERWREWVQSERPINTSAHLKADADVNEVRARLRLQFPGLDIRNGQELRDLALGIFEQTFQVTAALNGIGVVVAIAGLLLGLFAIFEESNRTWETLDHLGFSFKRLVLTAGIEGAGIALSAWISGTLIGIVLGWLLIAVINVQSFGWTLQWQLPVVTFIYFGGALVLAGFLCGSASGAWWHLKRLG